MNYKSLAAHNAACNWIFRRFQDCENEHPFRKFLGYCEDIQKEMHQCIKEQREIRRNKNLQIRRKTLETEETERKENSD